MYLGVLACPGESIGRWPKMIKSLSEMPEVIILAKPWILEVSDTNYNIKEKFAYIYMVADHCRGGQTETPPMSYQHIGFSQ